MHQLPTSLQKQKLNNSSSYKNYICYEYCENWYVVASISLRITLNKLSFLKTMGMSAILSNTRCFFEFDSFSWPEESHNEDRQFTRVSDLPVNSPCAQENT